MIVKVTMPTSSDSAAIVTLEDGQKTWLSVSPKLAKRMGTNTMQFFEAHYTANGALKLGNYAPWQDWSAVEPNTYETATPAQWAGYENGQLVA